MFGVRLPPNRFALVVSILIADLAITVAQHEVSVLVDADPALGSWMGLDVDDDLAIAFLASARHVKLLGLTATFGNAPLGVTCPRLMQLRKELGLNIPVACGPSTALGEVLSTVFGLSNSGAVAANEAAQQLAAVTRNYRIDKSTKASRIVWLSLGAMTNVASALRQLIDGNASSLPDEIVVLGGRRDGGFELNLWADAEAAEYLVAEGTRFVNVTVVPIDTLADAVVGMRNLEELRRECSRSWVHQYIGVLKRYAYAAGYLHWYMVGGSSAAHGFRPWDVAAAAAVAYPGQLFRKTSCHLASVKGSRLAVEAAEVPCDAAGSTAGLIRVLSELAAPNFIAVMMGTLCDEASTPGFNHAATNSAHGEL